MILYNTSGWGPSFVHIRTASELLAQDDTLWLKALESHAGLKPKANEMSWLHRSLTLLVAPLYIRNASALCRR